MDETKWENKLSCFFAKVKKLVTDYMQYIDTQVSKLIPLVSKCEELCERAESCTVELGDIDTALEEIIEIQNSILNGGGTE